RRGWSRARQARRILSRTGAMSEPTDNEKLLPAAPPAGEGTSPRPPVVVVPRWLQLVVAILGGLGLYAVARAAGPVLLLFLTAAITALILNPLVSAVQRARVPRGLAILVVYVGF